MNHPCLNSHGNIGRRSFNAAAIASAFAAQSSASATVGTVRANDVISLGVVGLGSRGFNLLDDFLALPQCRIAAVCDVDDLHYRDGVWGKGRKFGRQPAVQHIKTKYEATKSAFAKADVAVDNDYRKLIARSDIDAVVIATPDHWHALCTLEALDNGKDVYCEKPITHLFAEGQAVVAKVQQKNAVFQTGSQQRSAVEFQKLVTLARNGVLGKINTIEVGLPAGYAKPMGSIEVVKPGPTLDYDFWCGPSEVLPLMQARHHRWWRGHRAYGGGVLMDWIGHHNDIAHWAIGMERSGPVKVEAVDWTFPATDVYNTPQQYTIRSTFAGGTQISISTVHKTGLKVIGDDGWVFADRGKLEASNPEWLAASFQPGEWKIEPTGSHAQNFLNCIASRKECIAPAEIAHRSITPGHLGFVSHAIGAALQWNPTTETILNNERANTLLREMKYRQPWDQIGQNV